MSAQAIPSDAQPAETPQDTPATSPGTEQPTQSAVDPSLVLGPLEAMLVSSDRPLKLASIGDAMAIYLDQPISTEQIEAAIAQLNDQYEQQQRAFRIEQISGGYRMMTLPEHAPIIAAMHRSRATTRLSKPALETLAIIAYRQP